MEKQFYSAVARGNIDDVNDILKKNPDLDVNWANTEQFDKTALHSACESDYDFIVSILLAHPDIDVNKVDEDEDTPFMRICVCQSVSSARLLLKDLRVDVNKRDIAGNGPLMWAVSWGFFDIIQLCIASGRELDFGTLEDYQTGAIGQMNSEIEIDTLLGNFKKNPLETRHFARVELGMFDELAAEIFAVVVFVSDGLLQIKKQGNPFSTIQGTKFFSIVKQLPLELQMLICYRAVGSNKELISSTVSEIAFRNLAKWW